jgi:carnitine-CoA ligase
LHVFAEIEHASLAPLLCACCRSCRRTPNAPYGPDEKLYSGLSLTLTHANARLGSGLRLEAALRYVLSRRFTKSRLWNIARKHGAP